MKFGLAILALLCCLAMPMAALANCRNGASINYGDTLESIAQRCRINVETLKQANPGIQIGQPQNGLVIRVPPPALPSPVARGSGKGIIGPVTRPGGFTGQIEVQRP